MTFPTPYSRVKQALASAPGCLSSLYAGRFSDLAAILKVQYPYAWEDVRDATVADVQRAGRELQKERE